MTKIIGKIESLKALKKELEDRNINIFNSIGDIKNFQREFDERIKNVFKDTEKEILNEIQEYHTNIDEIKDEIKELPLKLNQKIKNLRTEISVLSNKRTNFITKYFVKYRLKRKEDKRDYYLNNFENIIINERYLLENNINDTYTRISHLTNNKGKLVKEKSREQIERLNNIKDTIDNLYPLISGAIGENLVVKQLSKLSDHNVLFNDFQLNFEPPIYNKQKADRIHSIQIDHLLVTYSGIFLIETKNWSKESIESLNLRSPVDQILRTSYALFVFLNSSRNGLLTNNHHWGKKKIPIKNILVMINNKPRNDFKYVKVLKLQELNSYIEYFDPIFEEREIENIVSILKSHKD